MWRDFESGVAVRRWGILEISVPFIQYCREPKTAIKKPTQNKKTKSKQTNKQNTKEKEKRKAHRIPLVRASNRQT